MIILSNLAAPIAFTAIISVTSVVILLTPLVILFCIMYKFELRPRICKSSVAPISEGVPVGTDYDNSRDDDKTPTPIQQLTGGEEDLTTVGKMEGRSTAVDTIDSKENVVEVHQC